MTKISWFIFLEREIKEKEKDGNSILLHWSKIRGSKRSKNSIKRNYVVAELTLENYDGKANDNLKQDFLREHLKHNQSN